MSGGNEGAGDFQSVEALQSDGSPGCSQEPSRSSLLDLPKGRSGHTQTGLVVCGGGVASDTLTTCVKFSFHQSVHGSWIQVNKLKKRRAYHTSWETPEGTVLMGGSLSGDTTELLDKSDSVVVRSSTHFPLKYWTE